MPPLAGGYTDRPDTAHGIVATLVPGSTVALVPAQAAAEGPSNWLGACGKTQIAVIIAESLWRSGAKVLGRGHPDTLAISAKLAAAYQASGRMPSALQLFEQTCAESDRVLGPDHADTLTRRVNLAHLYFSTGRVGDAITLLRETAAGCELVLPSRDPLIQVIRQSLANIAGDG